MNGNDLKAARKRLGLTQARLGEILGYSRNMVNRMESDPDRVNCRKISPSTAGFVCYMLRDLDEGRWTGKPEFD